MAARQTPDVFAIVAVGTEPDQNLTAIQVVARDAGGAELFNNTFATVATYEGDAFQVALVLQSPPLEIAEVTVTVSDIGGESNAVIATVNGFSAIGEACIAAPSNGLNSCEPGVLCANPSGFVGVCEAPPGAAPVLTTAVVDEVVVDSAQCAGEEGANEVRYRLTGTADLSIETIGIVFPDGLRTIGVEADSVSATTFDILGRLCVVSVQEVDEVAVNFGVLDTAGRPSNTVALTHPNFVPEPPAQWTCSELTFGGADGCHCGCGELDPDCGAFPTINNCEICDAPGGCAVAGATCPGEISDLDIAQCVGPVCGDGIINQPNEECEPAGEGTCDINCQIIVPPLGDFCAAAEALQNGVTVSGDTTGQPEVLESSCNFNGASGEDVVFTYTTVADNVGIQVEVLSTDGGDHLVAMRAACEDAASELGCEDEPVNSNDIELLVASGPFAAGTELVIFVDSFRPGTFDITVSEAEAAVLGQGEECDPDSVFALCDDTANLQCVSTAGVFTCEVQQVLDLNDACVPTDTSAVCDAGAGLVCDANTNVCVGVLQGQCSAATALQAGPNSFTQVSNTLDVPSTCLEDENANVFVYTVQTDGNSVAFDIDPGAFASSAIWDTCEDPGSEAQCFDFSTDGFVLAGGPRAAGDQIFVWTASQFDQATIDINVQEDVLQTLGAGDECVTGDVFNACDVGFRCLPNAAAGNLTCQEDDFPNDTCAAPVDLTTQAETFSGSLAGANGDYDPQDYPDNCTGFAASGPDLVYEVPMSVGQTLTVTYRVIDGDASIYLLDACDLVGTQCVAGADDTVNNADEILTFTATESRSYFLIADRFGTQGNSTDFTMTWTLTN